MDSPLRSWRKLRSARRLLAAAAGLVAEQQLESGVLLDVANHYANEVHPVADEDQGRRLVRALAHGYALRVSEEQQGTARPVPLAIAAAIAPARAQGRPAAAVAHAVDSACGEPGRGAPAGLPAPPPLGARGWRRAVETLAPGPADPRSDTAHALAYGYLVRCAEAALAAGEGGSLLAPDAPELPSLDALLHVTDARLAAGDELFASPEARVALVLGVLHGLGLEEAAEATRETAVAAARAGYAFRRAEEDGGLRADRVEVLEDACESEALRELQRWDALQALAWELADGPATAGGASSRASALELLAGHPDRGDAIASLADAAARHIGAVLTALPIADTLRAVRFGYALRAAEAGVPQPGSTGSS